MYVFNDHFMSLQLYTQLVTLPLHQKSQIVHALSAHLAWKGSSCRTPLGSLPRYGGRTSGGRLDTQAMTGRRHQSRAPRTRASSFRKPPAVRATSFTIAIDIETLSSNGGRGPRKMSSKGLLSGSNAGTHPRSTRATLRVPGILKRTSPSPSSSLSSSSGLQVKTVSVTSGSYRTASSLTSTSVNTTFAAGGNFHKRCIKLVSNTTFSHLALVVPDAVSTMHSLATTTMNLVLSSSSSGKHPNSSRARRITAFKLFSSFLMTNKATGNGGMSCTEPDTHKQT